MKKTLVFGSVLGILALSLSCTAPVRPQSQTRPLPQEYVGTWMSKGTTARFTIKTQKDNTIILEAWDQSDGEKFAIESVLWDGSTLSATMRMPSTGHTTTGIYTPLDDNTLQEEYSGDAEGTLIWTRVIGE